MLVAAEPFSAGVFTYAWAFAQGVGVDFTPCVYPLIPITVAVFGAKGVSRPRALLLAAAYVLGMSVLYTALGILVALTGSAFGEWLGNPWVVIPITAILVALAASMFGAFDLQLPTSMQGRLNQVGGAGIIGAFLMGLVSGPISAPCTGPVLLSLLTLIAESSARGSSVFFGGSLLFVYSLGMGSLFFAVALGASLFRPGPWMAAVKSVFGIALLATAGWFLRPISPAIANFIISPAYGLWIAVAMVIVGIALGAVHLSFKAGLSEQIRKSIGVGLATVGIVLALNNILYVPPMEWHHVASIDDLSAEFATAKELEKPIVIDFYADWCGPCKELEKLTFHAESVKPRLANEFHLIKIDMSQPNEEQEAIRDSLGAKTLPTVLIYAEGTDVSPALDRIRVGEPALDATAAVRGIFVEADIFLDKLKSAS